MLGRGQTGNRLALFCVWLRRDVLLCGHPHSNYYFRCKPPDSSYDSIIFDDSFAKRSVRKGREGKGADAT